ncbi:hypothetical protein ACLOJK_012124 [Asimina triloba]
MTAHKTSIISLLTNVTVITPAAAVGPPPPQLPQLLLAGIIHFETHLIINIQLLVHIHHAQDKTWGWSKHPKLTSCRQLPAEMEEEAKGARIEALEVEAGVGSFNPSTQPQQQHLPTSAHTIDHDSWKQVGLLMVTSFNCGYILTFSNLMLVPLGWTWGLLCLAFVAAFAWYANWLLAGFHVIDGRRFIRYRDLMGFVFGECLP